MPTPGQEQQLTRPQSPNPISRSIVALAVIFFMIAFCCFIVGLTILALNSFGLLRITWSNYLTIGFATGGAIFAALNVLISTSRRFFRSASSLAHLEAGLYWVFSMSPHSKISSPLPPTDATAILQREEAVEQIYEMLTRPEITAIVLTGIAGIGKSTLAALVYRSIEKQRRQRWRGFRGNKGLFAAETLWLKVDSSKKIIDIAEALFKYLDKSVPPVFDNLSPQAQALALTTLLKTAKKPRLIILDQFDTLFNIHTGDALRDHPGIGEWLDALNSERCKCKILFTSCSWLQGTRVYPRIHMQEYHVKGASVPEGVELLRIQRVQGTEAEVRRIIDLCGGHMFALTELINRLQKYQKTLTAFLKNDLDFQLWRGDVARHLLKDLYTRQLDAPEEHKLLSAFAVYHIPVSLEAAEAVLDSKPTRRETRGALDVLLTQHLLRPSGEGDYELHPIVAHYIRYDLEESDEQSSYRPSRETYIKVADYCLGQAKETCPPQGQRRNIQDVRFLVEAVRHLCQSEQWQRAYELMHSEDLPTNLKKWGENNILRDLYQLLLPSEKWQPSDAQKADIYSKLGEIYIEMFHTDERYAEEAMKYFKLSLIPYNMMKDHISKCSLLKKMGMLYLMQGHHRNAMAFFLQAERLLRETQSSGEEEVDECKEKLRIEVGEEQYNALLREVEPHIEQIVQQILS